MNIVLVHNHYQQPGGEDQVFGAEIALLKAQGHEVTRYTVHNDEVVGLSSLALAKSTFWNTDQHHRLRTLFHNVRPDVVHVHNTLPLISPAVYYAAHAEGAAVVQTLHNFRYSCVNGLFYRDGHVCEDCLGKTVPWPGVVHGCYRGSRAASAVVAGMLGYHKLRGTYAHEVDQYIVLSEFSRQKLVKMGLPEEKLSVKPNFVDSDPGAGTGTGGYALFVGRLSQEKGIPPLLAAWERLGSRLPLKVVGDGPQASLVELAASQLSGVEWLGRKPRDAVLVLMQEAILLVFPSVCYETFGMTIVEAFAAGTPVVASDIGTMSSLVTHGRTGLHFEAGNADDLVAQVEWALEHPGELAAMRVAARAEYEEKYTAEVNYRMLMGVYERAIEVRRQ